MGKIYLASPIWRYLDVRCAHAITTVMSAAPDRGEHIYWETLDGDALISRTRSQLATKFLNNPELADADVMVILDDDVQFSPQDFFKIAEGARRTGDLYGGIYVTRSREPHTACLAYPGQEITFGPEAAAVEIRYLATGFMAIPRHICQEMVDFPGFDTIYGKERIAYCEQGVGDFPMYDMFRPFCIREADGRIHYLSEDWAFCERARQMGYKVWADPSIMLQHRAVVSVTVHDLNVKTGMLSAEGAPSKGDSVLEVGPDEEIAGGSQQDELVIAV